MSLHHSKSQVNVVSIGLPRIDPQTLRRIPSRPKSIALNGGYYYYRDEDQTSPVAIRNNEVVKYSAYVPSNVLPTPVYGSNNHDPYFVSSVENRIPSRNSTFPRPISNNTDELSKGELILGYKPAAYATVTRYEKAVNVQNDKNVHSLSQISFDSWSSRLRDNWTIGASRAAFLLKHIPALLLILVGAWILLGQQFFKIASNSQTKNATDGVNAIKNNKTSDNCPTAQFPLSQLEFIASIAMINSGAIVMLGVTIWGFGQHKFSYKQASKQCIARVLFSHISIILSAITLIFTVLAALELKEINYVKNNGLSISNLLPLYCFSLPNRFVLSAIVVLGTILIMAFSLLSIIFGSIALCRLSGDRNFTIHKEPVSNGHIVAYSNPVVTTTDEF